MSFCSICHTCFTTWLVILVRTEDCQMLVLMFLSSELHDDQFLQRLASIISNSHWDWWRLGWLQDLILFCNCHKCQWNFVPRKGIWERTHLRILVLDRYTWQVCVFCAMFSQKLTFDDVDTSFVPHKLKRTVLVSYGHNFGQESQGASLVHVTL